MKSAKIYMAEENNNHGLRCRSRSCSRASSEEGFYTPSPPTNDRNHSSIITPGYGLKNRAIFEITPDSGLETSNGEFKPSTIKSKLVEKASHMISDDVKNNLADLKKQWKKQKMALYTNSPTRNNFISMRTHDLLPIVVMLITMGSALFTLLIMFNALNNNPSHKNMKYESIEFAHRKKMEQMEKMFPLVDEFGTALGGKKAAIQFAYNLKNKLEENEEIVKEENILSDEEIVNRLTLKVTNDVMKMYEELEENLDKDAKRQKLLEKIAKFGHFGTTKVKALDLDAKVEPKKVEPVPEKVQNEPKKVENEPEKVENEPHEIQDEPQNEKIKSEKAQNEPQNEEIKLEINQIKPVEVKNEPVNIEEALEKIHKKLEKLENPKKKKRDLMSKNVNPLKVEDDPFRFLSKSEEDFRLQ